MIIFSTTLLATLSLLWGQTASSLQSIWREGGRGEEGGRGGREGREGRRGGEGRGGREGGREIKMDPHSYIRLKSL